MRKAYKYIDDDRVVVTRPSVMHEVEALKALRTDNASWCLQREPGEDGIPLSSVSGLVTGIREMLDQGWARSSRDTRGFKEELWKANEFVVEGLLRDG